MPRDGTIPDLEIQIVPAILVRTRSGLLERINAVKPCVRTIQIDVMDNDFVPNKTIGIEELQDLPEGVDYEFHWMVQRPEDWIAKIKGKHMHIVHLEAKMDFGRVKREVAKKGARLGIAINPPTPVEKAFAYEKEVSLILVMSVNPGFSGQGYMAGAEQKIHILRQRNPNMDIEVDGGINLKTIAGAARAGANRLCAASAIFAAPDVKEAIEGLSAAAMQQRQR